MSRARSFSTQFAARAAAPRVRVAARWRRETRGKGPTRRPIVLESDARGRAREGDKMGVKKIVTDESRTRETSQISIRAVIAARPTGFAGMGT